MSKATMVLAFITALVGMASGAPGGKGAKDTDPLLTAGISNTNICPVGYTTISSQECADAASTFDSTYVGIVSGDGSDYPKGCAQAFGSFYYNRHNVGAAAPNYSPICGLSPATPEPTGNPTPGPTGNPTPGPTGNPTPGPTGNPTPGPTSNPTPGPTTNPTPPPTSPPTPGPTASPTLEPVKVAAAAFNGVLSSISGKKCYPTTDAAGLDMKRLKSAFASYKLELRTSTVRTVHGRAGLRAEFQDAQKIFAAAKRSLRTLKRTAKLGGKCPVQTETV